MELKLANGQYVLGKYQGLETVEGTQEILQRVLMKLQTKRGEFLPMPQYGSRLYLLAGTKPSQLNSAAKQFVLEALSDEPDLQLQELEILRTKEYEIKLELLFIYKGNISLKAETII